MKYIELKNNEKYYFDKMKVMGIVNATPDSFYEGSRVNNIDLAVQRALKMIDEGADIIDIGGESTRPGSEPVSEEDEIKRVVPIIEGIRKNNKEILISIDTYRSGTALKAVEAGADIINDISAMTFDKDMIEVVKRTNVPVVLMHIKGTPKDMQKNPVYEDVVKEVSDFFKERIEFATSKGIKKSKIIVDPGIGFGKNFEHNMELIKKISDFHDFEIPILLAVSRKSSIGRALGELPAEERLEGTIAVTCFAAMNDIEIIRVHDVKENKRAARMIEVLK